MSEIKEMNRVQRIFVQSFIDFLCDMKKENLDNDIIEYMNLSAHSTRRYMKAIGSWDFKLDEVE